MSCSADFQPQKGGSGDAKVEEADLRPAPA